VKEQILQWFSQAPELALAISLLASVLVAVLGVLPSVFITAANLAFFGFWQGTLVSFAGEALGALVSFVLYRKGFRSRTGRALERFPKARRLLDADGREAFVLVLSLRLLPFVPSGLVTFAAAVGKMGLVLFVAASTIGKAPALLLEAWSVYEVSRFGTAGKAILAAAALGLLFWLWRRPKPPKSPEPS